MISRDRVPVAGARYTTFEVLTPEFALLGDEYGLLFIAIPILVIACAQVRYILYVQFDFGTLRYSREVTHCVVLYVASHLEASLRLIIGEFTFSNITSIPALRLGMKYNAFMCRFNTISHRSTTDLQKTVKLKQLVSYYF